MTNEDKTFYKAVDVGVKNVSARDFDEVSSSSVSTASSASSDSSATSTSSSITEYSSASPGELNEGWDLVNDGEHFGNHGGTNWIPQDGDEVAGVHYNVGLFWLKPGYTLNVKAHDGSAYGQLEIQAASIQIGHGAVINGTGRGHRGGGGGGASGTGAGSGGAVDGQNGSSSSGAAGGRGGAGEGSFGGSFGISATGDGASGSDGGYASSGINGDESVDQNVMIGCGGGGGAGGGANEATVGGGGGGGGAGGARILLWGTNVTLHGSVNAKGTLGGDASDANGAAYSTVGSGLGFHPESPAYSGGDGGSGSGGGVLVWARHYDAGSGTIDARGGGEQTSNGGTIKIFADETIDEGTYLSGRTYLDETEYGTSSSSTGLRESSQSTLMLTSSDSTLSSESSVSTELLTSSDSSETSVSSHTSVSSPSSVSSSSSNYGFLEKPWDVTMASVNPVTRTMVVEWKWTTQDHWGNYVTPTGFIVERKIGVENYTVLTYSILPNSPPTVEDYSYTDVLSDSDASKVFALGYQLVYRVRAYWVTP